MIKAMNWKTIISDIQSVGRLTQAQIGKACGTTQSTISSLFNQAGAQPAYPLGAKLMELHKKTMRKSRTTASA